MSLPRRVAATSTAAVLFFVLLLAGCAGEPAPVATRLVAAFEPEAVEGSVAVEVPEPTVWRFDGTGTVAPAADDAASDETNGDGSNGNGANGGGADNEDGNGADGNGASGNGATGAASATGMATSGWSALHGIEDLAVVDGVLRGTTGELPFLVAERPEGMDDDDLIHAIELRMRVSEGESFGVSFDGEEEVNLEMILAQFRESPTSAFEAPLLESEDFETYTLTAANATFLPWFTVGQARHILLVPSDVEGAEFEIESVRLITRREHLASIESGVGWQGLSEIYRETIVSRAPERVSFDVDVPDGALFDLAIGTIEHDPVTFVVRAGERELLRRTITTPHRWEEVPFELDAPAGTTTVTLALESAKEGALGFWGSPVVRRHAARPEPVAGEARRALTDAGAPRGVILIIADTLRKDHLDAWGYGRETAPTLSRMAAEGTRFADNISQGTWTKVSVPSILTSLYPSTHGIVDLPDRISPAAVTIEEVFQQAGYATFHTSSVPFTGWLTNLHQGSEVLHEASSVGDLGHSSSKTARTYFDRFLSWLDGHHEVPFFALVHVFDPHSPYRPYPPYDTLYNNAADNDRYEADLEAVSEHIESAHMRMHGLPMAAELEEAGVDQESFIGHQHAWYDASIRAMDAEIARLLERLQALGLAEDTLIAFIADHGEEFLEHGRPWHGLNVYGYMINTPMMLWWPGVVPAGLVVDETTQSIDLTPTILDLTGLEIPEIHQGQSMVPLLASPENPESLGWEWRPAFAERKRIPTESIPGPDMDSYAIIAGGWKLIHNVANLPEGWPEYELYDHAQDPLNLEDVADANPEVVQQLAARLNEVRTMAEAARLSDEALTETMDPAALERLRALGYIR